MAYINNQLKKDHYVYVLRDFNLIVKYVGEGRKERYKQKSGRSEKYLEILNNDGSIELVCKNLTKNESHKMESYFIDKHKNTIINIQRQSVVKSIEFEKLKDVFCIDDTSVSGLSWKKKLRNVKGLRAGTIGSTGYYSVSYKGSLYKVHRIIWCLKNQIDLDNHLIVHHIDGNPSNNLYCNLQTVSQVENSSRRINVGKPVELLGISVHSKRGKDNARLMVAFYYNDVKYSKEFSLNKYPYDVALNLALTWKEFKMKGLKCTM